MATDDRPPNAIPRQDRRHRFADSLIWVLLLATVVRVAAVVATGDELSVDRDAYLGLAESIRDGRGYSIPETTKPTAFRPPLYPLLIAVLQIIAPGVWLLAVFQIVAGVTTVWLCGRMGQTLISPAGGTVAALLAAFDPLLVRYTALPMTETLFTLLCTWLLWEILRATSHWPAGTFHGARLGLAFGMAALCRPTIWVFLALLIAAGSLLLLARWKSVWQQRRVWFTVIGSALVVTLLVVGPWGIRNLVHFGKPILTTTHGGYTLLLGNNDVFDREVVQAPWGTVWSSESLTTWQHERNAAAARALGPNASEVDVDRWMSQQAWTWIGEHPNRFLAAAGLRLRRLWQLAPIAEAGTLPPLIVWGIRGWYALLFLAAAVGLFLVIRNRDRRWLPALLLIASICLLHAFYWSNARMRAPITPAIAVLAAAATTRKINSER